ncbi:Crp/Fnr family transcriptional regulator [Pediococcus stilesii]|uniref:Crp/Fnr family transcriptional regulator n=1 Tax=Pediococcus stilesii TaxID=331679 RepID=A0A5R9BY60_9LACO|nr:Crp/Fnr family transcriptional regulator [Pediococcus stilesii]TLQ05646.1 Crp/Fnr family transcriptional regulator [Pediococcus stilesii]
MNNHVDSHHCVPLVPIFQNLTDEQSAAVEGIVHHRLLNADTPLYSEGDEINALSIIANGQIKVFRTAENGKEQLLYLLQAGDINGEAALFNQLEHNSSAVTLTPTTVCSINRSDFQKLLTKFPQISVNVMNTLGSRLIALERQTTKSNTESVASRLADYLVETSSALHQNPVQLPLKNKDLATLLGTTPETISRYLKRWETSQLISKMGQRRIQINDIDELLLQK